MASIRVDPTHATAAKSPQQGLRLQIPLIASKPSPRRTVQHILKGIVGSRIDFDRFGRRSMGMETRQRRYVHNGWRLWTGLLGIVRGIFDYLSNGSFEIGPFVDEDAGISGHY